MGVVRGCTSGVDDEDPTQVPPITLLIAVCWTPPEATMVPLGVARLGVAREDTTGVGLVWIETLRLPLGDGESERRSADS